MYISEDTINQIKNQVNIVEIIGEFVPLKRTGQNYKALCPFHTEKTPSFIVNPQKGIFHCFGCGVGGNVFNFLMKFKGIGFPDAVRLLGERVGVHIKTDGEGGEKKGKADILYAINKTATSFFINNLLSEKGGQALKYLKIRKIDSNTTKAFHVGYSLNSWDALLLYLQSRGFGMKELEESGLILKKRKGDGYYDRFRNRIIFPIQDSIGRFVGFGARLLETENDKGPKYINSSENLLFHKGKQLYGFYAAEEFIRKEDSVFVVEGYFDVIRMYKEGLKNTVAPLGTALTEEQIALVLRYTRNIYLLFDPDEAGLKAALRSINLLFKREVEPYILRFPQGKDPGDFFD
ncbi:MAG: DNA primase, partial [Spirochaetota bacterium]